MVTEPPPERMSTRPRPSRPCSGGAAGLGPALCIVAIVIVVACFAHRFGERVGRAKGLADAWDELRAACLRATVPPPPTTGGWTAPARGREAA